MPPPRSIETALCEGIVVFDGAMGTELYKRHVFVNASFEGLNLTQPDLIRGIHRDYAEAGADVLTTNSYGANTNLLAAHGLEDRMTEINHAAAAIARSCAGDTRWVAGSIGPYGKIPSGRSVPEAERVQTLVRQAAALAEGGADFLIFETISSTEDLQRACTTAAQATLPYMVSFAIDRHGETAQGESLAALLALLSKAGRAPFAVGLNCGGGPENALGALERLVPLTTLPIVVQPNAGIPRAVDGRMIYMTSPEYLATYAKRFIDLGVHGVGGCCGTGPEHIRDIAKGVRPLAVAMGGRGIVLTTPAVELKPRPDIFKISELGGKLAAGEWIASVEITPPRGWDLGPTVEKARQCRAAGVNAINIPDGPRASARMSPLITALTIKRDAGIETILHVCCRDRSLLGLNADLLGCAAADIRNLLFISGDPPKLGDFPSSSAVFDADSIKMTRIQDRMNRGVDLGGKRLDPPTSALIGVGADPNAMDMKRELQRIREKAEAGAAFIITQPVFDPSALLRFLEAIRDVKLPVIAGIWPLASYRNAEFMRNEVPGVMVPDGIMKRMSRGETKEAQRAEGIAIARESIATIRKSVAGVQVSAPLGNVTTALAVLAE